MWELEKAWNYEGASKLLKQGWEPFAVTVDRSNTTIYHFRRFMKESKMKVYVIKEDIIHERETIKGIYLNEEKAKKDLSEWQKLFPETITPIWYELTEYEVEE